jgi:CelD/BcsL family acetyltransferase involved in cellulose biosynthesis
MYVLGRKLFHVTAPLWVCESHFLRLGDDVDALPAPLRDDPDAAGAMINSQPVPGDLPPLVRRGDVYRWVPNHFDRRLLRTDGTWSDYLAKFTGRTRKRLVSQVRKYVQAAGEDPLRIYRTPDEVRAFLASARGLSPRTYQERIFRKSLPATPEFFARTMQLAEEGRTLGAILEHRGSPACFWWFTLDRGVLVSEYTGYDAALRALSPGTTLFFLLLPHLFADPAIHVIDFGEGDGEYKRMFATESRRCAEVFWMRTRPSTLTMMAAETGTRALRRAFQPIEEELDRRGLRAPLTRLVRGQALA